MNRTTENAHAGTFSAYVPGSFGFDRVYPGYYHSPIRLPVCIHRPVWVRCASLYSRASRGVPSFRLLSLIEDLHCPGCDKTVRKDRSEMRQDGPHTFLCVDKQDHQRPFVGSTQRTGELKMPFGAISASGGEQRRAADVMPHKVSQNVLLHRQFLMPVIIVEKELDL